MNPPTDLNVNIGHEQILQSFDIPVKNHLPSATVCPLCRRESLYVYVSPGSGGRWYICKCCTFTGDSIELYAAGHGIQDLHSAIIELASRQILPMSQGELSRECVNDYIDSYIKKRKHLSDFFEQSRNNVSKINQHWLGLLQHYHLWMGQSLPEEWRTTLGTFLGCSSFHEAVNAKLDVPKSMSNFLVCPCYDVPGRIASLLLIGMNQTHRVHLCPINREDGLMMLDSTGLDDDIVIAMDNPIFALQLQRKNFIYDGKPLKIVVYGSDTDKAWMSICARRVVFWNNVLQFKIFQQAKKHARAYISQHPRFTASEEYLRHATLPKVFSIMTEAAVPWSEAIKQYILTHDDRGEICDTIRGLDLTAYDMNRIYELCTTVEREIVKQVLGEKPIEQYVYVNNQRIVEADGAWWIVRNGHRELMCNAVIRFLRAVHTQDSGVDRYEGTITANGKTVRFQENIETVEHNPREWLRKVMMASGLGMPTVHRVMGRHLVEIAKQFCPPIFAQGYSRIGWYPDQQAFIFPNFSIRDGKIDDTLYAMGSKLPAANLLAEPLTHGDWDAALTPEPENATIWAGLACFMSNLLAPVIGAQVVPVGFVGGIGSLANIVAKHLIAELGLPSYAPPRFVQKRCAYVFHNVEKVSEMHDYPMWVDFNAGLTKLVHHLSADSTYNIITQFAMPQAIALSVGDKWVFIHSSAVLSQRKNLPRLRGIMRFVAWLQARGFKLAIASNLQSSILSALSEWADEELHALDLAVFGQAAQMIQTPDMASMDRKFLQLIFWVREDQKLRIQHDDIYAEFKQRGTCDPNTRDAFIIVDDSAGKVFLKESRLLRALKRYPEPNIDLAIKELAVNSSRNGFESGSDGFILNLDHWNAEAKRWAKTRTPEY